jgi:hypothetical protein
MFGFLGQANRRARRFVRDTDNANILLGLIGLGLIISMGLPRLIPTLRNGGDCVNLPSPPGGNSRSMLAFTSDDQEMNLILEIEAAAETNLGDPQIRAGDPLIVRVIFENESRGAITLYLREGEDTVGSTAEIEGRNFAGLYFQIVPVNGTTSVSDPQQPGFPQKTTFALEDLHNLIARRRCQITVEFSAARLARMGIGIGDYRIQAVYRNAASGAPIIRSDATATPMFQDQGVWTGTTQSDEVRFTISP